MDAKTDVSITVTMTQAEAYALADALFEALCALTLPSEHNDDEPWNWSSNPKYLKDLHNLVKPPGHGEIKWQKA